MIVCPNCNHQNPDSAQICEACYTPLPAMTACPNCGATIQSDALFCGQCGTHLKPSESGSVQVASQSEASVPEVPELVPPDPLVEPEPLVETSALHSEVEVPSTPLSSAPAVQPPPLPVPVSSQTQLQQQTAQLLHVRSSQAIELPSHLSVIHVGKPNDRIPPDIDVSGFPDSDVVSRVHADIRVEGDSYYIEDVGSANGTYINNVPLAMGNRHRLRPGDRIALGKNDLVTFIFQIA
ncbi:MAG: FHA domain-containing protein [Desertifilum sp. SIO1I2]|nr:FHA domain-containing protein [Desertifilum sp. SIO1I2]